MFKVGRCKAASIRLNQLDSDLPESVKTVLDN